ncbi:MAG: chemotaxis protein CheW [Leptospiraceae bacterium]|nr:chemotaxis protein CheW [Leptospiraceae bacterium]
MKKNKKMQIVYWKIDDRYYGAEIKYCIETQKNIEILKIPYAQSYISGVANFRGDVITVLELPTLIYKKKIQGRIRDVVIRFQHEDKSIAISSDTLPEVMAIEKENLKDAEDYLDSLELEYISKVFDIKEGMVMILNIPNLWLVK